MGHRAAQLATHRAHRFAENPCVLHGSSLYGCTRVSRTLKVNIIVTLHGNGPPLVSMTREREGLALLNKQTDSSCSECRLFPGIADYFGKRVHESVTSLSVHTH